MMRTLVGRMRGENVAAQVVAAGVGVCARGMRAFVRTVVGVRADVSSEMAAYGEGSRAMRTGVGGLTAWHCGCTGECGGCCRAEILRGVGWLKG